MAEIDHIGRPTHNHASPSRQTVLQLGGGQSRRQFFPGGQGKNTPLVIRLYVQNILQGDTVQLSLTGEQKPRPLLPQGDHPIQGRLKFLPCIRLLDIVRGMDGKGVHRIIRAGGQKDNIRVFAVSQDLPRQLCPQHMGHTDVQQGYVGTAGIFKGVQHFKGRGVDREFDAVFTVCGGIGAKVLRDPLPIPGVVIANGYFQHDPTPCRISAIIVYYMPMLIILQATVR